MKTKKINLTELKQVIINIIKEDFENNEIIRDEIPEKIGQITGNENILDLLNKYSLSEVLDFISKTYNEWGEFDASSKAKEYSNDFIKTLY